mgnify:CR=1 FL=1
MIMTDHADNIIYVREAFASCFVFLLLTGGKAHSCDAILSFAVIVHCELCIMHFKSFPYYLACIAYHNKGVLIVFFYNIVYRCNLVNTHRAH